MTMRSMKASATSSTARSEPSRTSSCKACSASIHLSFDHALTATSICSFVCAARIQSGSTSTLITNSGVSGTDLRLASVLISPCVSSP